MFNFYCLTTTAYIIVYLYVYMCIDSLFVHIIQSPINDSKYAGNE